MNSADDLDPAAALTRLLREHPRGFSVSESGTLTPVSDAVRIKSMDQLAKLTLAPKLMQFPLPGGEVIEFRLRALSSVEGSEIDDLDENAPVPPQKKGEKGVLDYDDKDFKRRDRSHTLLKRTAVIVKGLLEVEIPGDDLEAKNGYLLKTFPPRILNAIEQGILGMTSKPVERAVFI